MKPGQHFLFPPFRLDPVNEQLWHSTRLLPLRAKTFAVLCYLVEHAGMLVTKEALLKAVWPDTHGAEGLPKKSIHELRKVLRDEAATPQFIETVARRRGWRFIAPLATAPPVSSFKFQVPSSQSAPTPYTLHPTPSLVGRETELQQLHGWLDRALGGERQVVFVTGEPGIGKTAVVDAFLAQVAGNGNLWLARGQCVEHHGAGEAYLPVLEALGRLCRTAEGEPLMRLLRRHAPTWLVQMPALIEDTELEALQRKVLGAAQERMLREIADALEALTIERPLVLWLEDLQWSDYSTLDLIPYLAQRRGPARLLLIGTYRPADVIVGGHPLKAIKQELQAHGQCAELPLRFLAEEDVTEYLGRRFAAPSPASAGEACPEPFDYAQDKLRRRGRGEGLSPASPFRELARLIHQSTEGNPLFIVNMVDYLVTQGVIVEEAGRWQVQARPEDIAVGVPDSLRQLIEKQIERLATNEQRMLEAASVAGAVFSTAAVAAGLAEQVGRVEEWCEGLARRGHFLAARGTERLSDGTIIGRYSFLHALYQKVLYEQLAVARRIRLHRRIGEGGETVYGNRAGDIAAELAMHFERGQDYRRAVHYLEQAAQNALRRSANREAIDHLTKGLELLKTLPDTPERTQQELMLQVALCGPLVMTKGYAAPEVERAYARARALCQQVEETPQLFPVLYGLCRFYVLRADFQTAYAQGEQLLRLAQRTQDPGLLDIAHPMLGAILFFRGEFALARTHMEQGVALYDPQQHRSLISLYGDDPKVTSLSHGACVLWYLGYPDQALKSIHEALTLARELSHPFSLALSLGVAAELHVYRREGQAAQERAEALIALAHEHGFPHFLAYGAIRRGWALAEQGQREEGIVQIRQGLAGCQAIGQGLGGSYFRALLAEAYSAAGQVKEGLHVLAEALEAAHKTGECLHEAELYRLKGQLTLQQFSQENQKANGKKQKAKITDSRPLAPGPQAEAEAEACFHKAIDIARKQSAKSLELRAVTSLSRLWQQQGKAKQAHKRLAEIYDWFTEGFDTPDLQAAKGLLRELAK